jgi:inosine-uridine nucleoside N-ribohydrolase
MPPHRLIIDTDPGVDDALAILLAAYSPRIELLGLTTVFGNVDVATATRNAGHLVSLMPRPVPVAAGAAIPLLQPPRPHAAVVHGHNGFGEVAIDFDPGFAPLRQSAVEFIIEQVRAQPGEITLVPLGPLTNIALALRLAPDIATKVKQVVLMGGAVYQRGNVSPVAEANIVCDPHAAQIVFSGAWPITMVGLDVTYRTIMPEARMEALRAHSPRVGGFLADIARHYAGFYRRQFGFDGFSMHDPATVVQLLQPGLFGTQRGQIEVVCEGRALGKTLFAPASVPFPTPGWGERDNVEVCLSVDGEGVLACFEDVIRGAP